jgi:hypothetical protein
MDDDVPFPVVHSQSQGQRWMEEGDGVDQAGGDTAIGDDGTRCTRQSTAVDEVSLVYVN